MIPPCGTLLVPDRPAQPGTPGLGADLQHHPPHQVLSHGIPHEFLSHGIPHEFLTPWASPSQLKECH